MTEMTCAELVELVTAYLEGALDVESERRFASHVAECPGCDTYLEQFRETIRQLGMLEPESIDAETRDRLLAAFHDWKAADDGNDPRNDQARRGH